MRLPTKTTAWLLWAGWLAWFATAEGPARAAGERTEPDFVTPNDFEGTDVQRINRAIEVALAAGKRVVIPRDNTGSDRLGTGRLPDLSLELQDSAAPEPDRDRTRTDGLSDMWLLDSAILLRSNLRLELDNCRIKLSDRCRDNFMRNVYVPDGITTNLHVRGIGNVVLEGADHPRATGDSGKTLGNGWRGSTYGTDAGIPGQSQLGGERNFGIYLTYVEDFSLEGFTIKDSHCWAICLRQCANGTLRKLGFESRGFKTIDGAWRQIANQDGIDLRQGCHDILIENITGFTGDDLIALTSVALPGTVTGDRDDVHHVTLRNITSSTRGHLVLLLNNNGIKMHDILIEGLTDTNPGGPKKGDFAFPPAKAAVQIGAPQYGGIAPVGDTSNVTIRNVTSRGRHGILVAGSLSESTISTVVTHGTNEPVTMESGPSYIRNVTLTDIRTIKD